MMKSIANEKLVSFKMIEEKVFTYVCEVGCEILRMMLGRYFSRIGWRRCWSIIQIYADSVPGWEEGD